jgi:TetR/AcrR family transcriptional regulator, fatty acid metabolism regulator protein
MERTKTREDKRERILESAAEVFDEHGYADATIDMVAANARIAKGSVYNYFSSKQELYTGVFVKQMAVQETDLLTKLENEPSPVNQLQLIFDHWYARYAKRKEVGRLVLECWASAARETQSGEDGSMAGMLQALHARWRQRMIDIVSRGQQSGHFRADVSPTMTAQVLLGMLDGLTLHGIIGMGIVVNDEFIERLKHGFLAVVGTDTITATTPQESERDA